ncbi:YadA-like family protein [Dyella kyungheensis]|uniref:YadA-like family protein n=1 Tax=Dyella kyungheensis TaxID=1242174 RepID=A0ABS2JYA7_9GAMM|nr:YadA-like family protein [Dyella kyungheensis]MBM7123619.1 YadA-like family protein [Dyella kyungheensis]
MNRIYRLVWSDSRRAWVPASELSTQHHRASRQIGFMPSARAFLATGLALCALAYHTASHAEGADDAKLNDLMSLAAKYEHPASQAAPVALGVDASSLGNRAVVNVPAAGHANVTPTPAASVQRKAMLAGVRVKTAVPIMPTAQQIQSGVAVPVELGSRVGAVSGAANVAALGQGLVSAVLPSSNDVADRNRSVTLATHANVTSSLVDDRAPAVVGADGRVQLGTPAIPLGTSGAAIAPVNASVGARAAVLANNGDLVDAHAHVGVSVPVLSSTPLVNANVNLHVGGQLVSALDPVLQPITGGLGSGSVTGVVSKLPATVDGVTGAVSGIVGGVTAGTPLAGVASGILPPVDSTLHNVATTVAGLGSQGGLGGVLGANGLVSTLPATVDGVSHAVNGVVGGVTAGTPLASVMNTVLPPVESTLHNVATTLAGVGAGSAGGLGNVGGMVSNLPATVTGVTNTVTGLVGGATAGTPLGGTVTSVVQPVVSTVNGVVGTVAGVGSGSGLGGVLGAGSGGLGNVGGLVSNLPATVTGVTNTVTGLVAGVTAGTPLGGTVTSVVQPVVSTVNGVVGTVAGVGSGSGLGGVLGSGNGLGGVVAGVTSTVGKVLQPVTGGNGGLGNVGGLVSNLPATVTGVTNTVTGVVGGVTAGTPLGGTVTSVVQPVVSTVNGVVGTVAGVGSGSGLGGVLGSGNGLGGVVSGVTSTVGSVLKPVTGGNGLGNLGGVVSDVTSTVGSVLHPVSTGGPLGAISNLPSTVTGVTNTVTGIVGAATAGTPIGGAVTGVLQPVTGVLNTVVGTVAGTASGSGLGGILGSSDASLGKVLPDVDKTAGDVTSTVGAVLSQPNGTGLANVLGQGGTASSLLGNLTNTVADTVNSVPGAQLGATGNGQTSGQNLLGVIPGASNLVDKALPGVASLLGVTPAASGVGGPGGGSGAAGVPVVPPPSATPTGLIVGNGGVVGTAGQLLGSSTNALFNNSNGYVTNGGLQVNSANFTQGYSVVSVAGIPLVNATPVGTVLTTVGGTTLGGTGSNSHLTLIGSVSSDSYITNINNGAPGGVLGLALPNSAPAWASTCANVLGVVQASCWAVNAAQDYQVLMGDGATANGSKEVVIGTNASHTLPAVTAATAFPGNGANDPTDPSGVPTDDYNARLGHSVVIGDSAAGTANAQTIIGANATASVANSVALGYASAATRGGQNSYAAYGMSTLQHSAGEVSIGAPGQERQITNVAAGSALTDAVNLAQLEAVSFATGNAVQYDDSTHNTVTMDSTSSTDGGVTGGSILQNLHQGSISATSTQAINGSQMWHWTQDTTNVYSNYSLYNAIQNIKPGGSTTINNNVKYYTVNSALADASATGANSVAAGPTATASGSNAVAVGNGANASADNSVALGSGSVADRANTVSVGSAGSERQITNVAAGSASTDAVNLGQMQASINNSTQGTVRYDTNTDGSTNYSSVTLGNGNAGTTIHNVANGVATSDAANVGQLNAGIQQAQNWAQNYTDQRYNQLNGQIQSASNRANAGIAAGMAMAGLPQSYEPGRSMAAVAAGTFRGESSIAVGVSTISQGGRWVYKLTGSADTRGDAGFSIGAGMQW